MQGGLKVCSIMMQMEFRHFLKKRSPSILSLKGILPSFLLIHIYGGNSSPGDMVLLLESLSIYIQVNLKMAERVLL